MLKNTIFQLDCCTTVEMTNVHVEYLYKLYTGNIGKKYEDKVKKM